MLLSRTRCLRTRAGAIGGRRAPRGLLTLTFAALFLLLQAPAAASCPAAISAPLPPTCTGYWCQCLATVDPVCHPSGKILDEFVSKGACETFDKPLTPVRPRLAFGGEFQTFERGEISHYSSFNKGAVSPDFMISAYQERTPTPPYKLLNSIMVRWGPTAPHKYDEFLVRWDRENNEKNVAAQHEENDDGDDPQQHKVSGGQGGAFRIDATAEGIYTIYVAGCDENFLGYTNCPQGWSYPVYVDRLPQSLQAVPAAPTNPNVFKSGSGILDVPDQDKIGIPEQFRIISRKCGDLRDMDDKSDHYEELEGGNALAWLLAARLITVKPLPPPGYSLPHPTDPLRGTKCYQMPIPLYDAVSAAILQSKQVSRPGTDISGVVRTLAAAAFGMSIAFFLTWLAIALFSVVAPVLSPFATVLGLTVSALIGILTLKSLPGDYDMRLVDFVSIYFEYGSHLSPKARDYLVDKLLSERGGPENRHDYVFISGLPTPIRETENHIWSTEVSRYLTNNILYDRSHDAEYDNDKNGMTSWILEGLQGFLADDFYELNARPYAAISYNALETLANYAAVGGGNCSQLAPVGTQSSRCDVRRAARSVVDYLNAHFAMSSSQFRRAAPFRRKPEFSGYPRLLTNGGDDMTWRLWAYTGGSDFVAAERNNLLMETADGYILAAINGDYRPPLLITDLMRTPGFPGDLDVQRFRSRARDSGTAEVYYRTDDYLISAGGRFEEGTSLSLVSDEERAWALPTTLMPTKQGDDYRDFVRIAGSKEPTKRNNLCVGPGFACGMNPTIPAGLPAACQRTVGNWTFIDFTRDDATCPFGFGYYVVVYAKRCSDGDCRDAAGDKKHGTFGFFEATPWRSFDAYVADVLALNQPEDFLFKGVNVYRSPTGRHVSFVIDSKKGKWDIVGYGNMGSIVNPERNLDKWPIAQGSLISSPKRACLFVDNFHLHERLIIDDTNAMNPRRSIIPDTMTGRCGCPLVNECLSPRAE